MKHRSRTGQPIPSPGAAGSIADLGKRWAEALRGVAGIGEFAVTLEDNPPQAAMLPVASLLPPDDRPGASDVETETLDSIQSPPALNDAGPLEPSEGTPDTLAEALAHAATRTQTGLIYIDESGQSDHFVSYQGLLEDAERVLAGLRERGLQPGDKVLFQFDKAEDFLVAFWGCTLGGFLPVPATVAPTYRDNNAAVDRVRSAWEELERPLIVAGDRLSVEIRSAPGLGQVHDDQVAAIGTLLDRERDSRWHEPAPEDPALFLLTSGSTGTPKVVVLTHSNLVSSAAAAILVHPFDGASTFLNWFPLDHVAGVVMFHFQPLWLGAQQVHGPKDGVLRQPEVWLDWIERYRATVTWAPNFAYGQVNEAVAASPDRSWDLSSMQFILNGGEAIVPRTIRRFMNLLAPFGLRDDTMYPGWGMSETSGGVIFSRSFRVDTTADDDPFVSLGHPYPGTALRIVDDSGEIVPESAIGRLQIRGVSVLKSYYRNPEASAAAFTDDGWFDTGDEGFLNADGLTLTGRAKETIIINGVNYPGHQIESVVEACVGVERSNTAACAVRRVGGDTDELAIFFTPAAPDDDPLPIVRKVRERVVQEIGLHPTYVLPLPAAEIPKTAIGKIQRPRLVQRFQAGDFDSLLARIDPQAVRGAEVPDWFFRKTWQPDNLAATVSDSALGRTLLLAADEALIEGLISGLSAGGGELLIAQVGSGFERREAGRWAVGPTDDRDLDRLLAEVVAHGGPVDHIIHAWSYEAVPPSIRDIDQLHAAQRLGVGSLGTLVGALDRSGQPETRLTVVTARAHQVEENEAVDYSVASISGWLKSLAMESPWLECRQCDLEGGNTGRDAAHLLAELCQPAGETEVAYRHGQRHLARLARLEMLAEPPQPLPIEAGGIYLIPGALGGMGVRLAQRLGERYGIKIVAIGRTPLPETDDWPRLLRENDPAAARIRSFQTIVGVAPDATYEAVDVTDLEGLIEVRRRAEERWQQPISGIIHLAGVNRERHWEDSQQHYVGQEDWDAVERIFQAKVYGTWTLAELVADRSDAVFVSISSVLAEFGAPGHGAYSAASSFLSGFAAHQRARARNRSWCLSWSMWNEVGMSEGSPQIVRDATVGRGFRLISPEDGEISFLAALARPQGDIIIGLDGAHPQVLNRLEAGSIEQRLAIYYTAKEALATTDLENLQVPGGDGVFGERVFRQVDVLPRTPNGEIDFDRLRDQTDGAEQADDDGDELSASMAKLWSQVLGGRIVRKNDRFFEIGGDSLKATQLLQRIADTFDVDVSLRDFFDDPTVSGLVRNVREEASTGG